MICHSAPIPWNWREKVKSDAVNAFECELRARVPRIRIITCNCTGVELACLAPDLCDDDSDERDGLLTKHVDSGEDSNKTTFSTKRSNLKIIYMYSYINLLKNFNL